MKGTLRAAIGRLGKHYGEQAGPPTTDPFELVLWENVAYLASPERRREAFEQLAREIGTSPGAIIAAGRKDLERVTARGILAPEFADKLRACAAIVQDSLDGDATALTRLPLAQAKKALRRFPGIGEPGAEKILLFSGREALLAPESNGLRVLVRLGFIREEKSYAQTYAAAREAAKGLTSDVKLMQQAHLLLHLHGRTLCRRQGPLCEPCPLASGCVWFTGPAPRRPGARKRTKG